MNASPTPQRCPRRRLSHHERGFPVVRRTGEQAKQREHATSSRAPRGGTRYGGADFGRELILKTLPISGTVLTAPAGARQPGCASPPVLFGLHRLADMRSCPSARSRVTSTTIRLLSHRHRTRQRPHRYSRNHRSRRVILPILECVRRVIEPLLSGNPDIDTIPTDDLQYGRDLGLVRRTAPVAIANPVYREVIPREFTWTTQETMVTREPAWYVAADGRLLTEKLLGEFQVFFREHSEHWVERFQYREAGPQLLLQAFLHRVVNGGGRVEREYGLGRMRVDLLVVWPVRGGRGGRRRRRRGSDVRVRPEGGRRGQGGAREPCAHRRTGIGADPRVHGPLRGGGRASGGVRPHAGQVVGGEGVSARGDGRRGGGDGAGDVAGSVRNRHRTLQLARQSSTLLPAVDSSGARE